MSGIARCLVALLPGVMCQDGPWQKAGRAYDVGLAPLGSMCPEMARGLLSYAVAKWHCGPSRRETYTLDHHEYLTGTIVVRE
jgi:hypothetical protein